MATIASNTPAALALHESERFDTAVDGVVAARVRVDELEPGARWVVRPCFCGGFHLEQVRGPA